MFPMMIVWANHYSSVLFFRVDNLNKEEEKLPSLRIISYWSTMGKVADNELSGGIDGEAWLNCLTFCFFLYKQPTDIMYLGNKDSLAIFSCIQKLSGSFSRCLHLEVQIPSKQDLHQYPLWLQPEPGGSVMCFIHDWWITVDNCSAQFLCLARGYLRAYTDRLLLVFDAHQNNFLLRDQSCIVWELTEANDQFRVSSYCSMEVFPARSKPPRGRDHYVRSHVSC